MKRKTTLQRLGQPLPALALLLLAAAPQPAAAQKQQITGQVLDSTGKPVAGADVADYWYAGDRNNRLGNMKPDHGVKTARNGKFTLEINLDGGPEVLLALDKERKRGGIVVVTSESAGKTVMITLGPLVTVQGQFSYKELNRSPDWTDVYMNVLAADFRLLIDKPLEHDTFGSAGSSH